MIYKHTKVQLLKSHRQRRSINSRKKSKPQQNCLNDAEGACKHTKDNVIEEKEVGCNREQPSEEKQKHKNNSQIPGL